MSRISRTAAALAVLFLTAATPAGGPPEQPFDLRSGKQFGFDYDAYICKDGILMHLAFTYFTGRDYLLLKIEKEFGKAKDAWTEADRQRISKAFSDRMAAMLKRYPLDLKKLLPSQERNEDMVDGKPPFKPIEDALKPIIRQFASEQGWPFYGIHIDEAWRRGPQSCTADNVRQLP